MTEKLNHQSSARAKNITMRVRGRQLNGIFRLKKSAQVGHHGPV